MARKSDGLYENQEPDQQPEFSLRGRLQADETGGFTFDSIKPCGYKLLSDGPVGRLTGALGLCLERPAHLHFRGTAPGYQVPTTHVFDRDDPAIGHDALFGIMPELLGQFNQTNSGWSLDVAFTLAPQAKGMTHSCTERTPLCH